MYGKKHFAFVYCRDYILREKGPSLFAVRVGKRLALLGGGYLQSFRRTQNTLTFTKHTDFNLVIYFVHYMPKLNNHSNTYDLNPVFMSVVCSTIMPTKHYVLKIQNFRPSLLLARFMNQQFWTVSYYIYKELIEYIKSTQHRKQC